MTTLAGGVQENEGQGALPVEGSIPDMTATTQLYLHLQRIYRAKADEHCAAVHAHAQELLRSLGRSTDEIGVDQVKLFCKNARALRAVRFRPIAVAAGDISAAALRQVCSAALELQQLSCELSWSNAKMTPLCA